MRIENKQDVGDIAPSSLHYIKHPTSQNLSLLKLLQDFKHNYQGMKIEKGIIFFSGTQEVSGQTKWRSKRNIKYQ